MSWDWGVGKDRPIIRYSVEPIGPEAGTLLDPLNEYSAARLFQTLREDVPGIDLQWFERLAKEFLVFNRSSSKDVETHHSKVFAAFDLNQSSVRVKAYFFPVFQANKTGQSQLTIVSQAITQLPGYCKARFSAYELFRVYMLRKIPEGAHINIEMIAIDCVEPLESRLKVYVRSNCTSFNSVKTIMTLDGQLNLPNTKTGLDELQILWSLLFGTERSLSEDLPKRNHRTAGILYNFEIRPGHQLPIPKVYLPVRHYAHNDIQVMKSLQTHLQQYQKPCQHVNSYIKAMQTIL